MSDFVPGVNDLIGYAVGDVIPGGNMLYDALGPDFAPGINESTGGPNMLGNNFAPGINESTGGANMLGNGGLWNNPLQGLTGNALKAAQQALANGVPVGDTAGTGAGNGSGSGTTNNVTSNPNLTADIVSGPSANLFNFNPSFGNMPMSNTNQAAPTFADGGEVHNPEFYSEGGMENRYVKGEGDGTSDSVPAMLASGEFVIPADVVSSLGNGCSDSGASVLDQFLATIREHKQDHEPNELPPDSEGPLAYLQKAKNKVDA